ncbi:MAG TPA: hypothetical protein VGE01_09180 [Fimbriimonas sp.]
MTAFFVLAALTALLVLGYLLLNRRSASTYHASAEYWVYLPGEQLPDQNEVMTRMVAQNPYAQKGRSPIGPSEGILFSDVRLHIAIVRRSQNAHVFRPDLFADVDVEAEDLKALDDALSFVKVRYTSDDPLPDKRHLQFLMHAADAFAELGKGTLVFDRIAETMYPREAFRRILQTNVDVTGPDLHLRHVWKPEPHGGSVETRGFLKIGLKELRTETVEADEAMLVTAVMEGVSASIWNAMAAPESVEVEAFEDRFTAFLERTSTDHIPVRILRIQAT